MLPGLDFARLGGSDTGAGFYFQQSTNAELIGFV